MLVLVVVVLWCSCVVGDHPWLGLGAWLVLVGWVEGGWLRSWVGLIGLEAVGLGKWSSSWVVGDQ